MNNDTKSGASPRPLPLWIWHPERDGRRRVVIEATFTTVREHSGLSLHAAFTGAGRMLLDGAEIASVAERPHNVERFRRIGGFPDTLAAGTHEIRLELDCRDIFPLAPVNSYLHRRRVGAIAFVQGDGLWLATDDSWRADGDAAAVVCRLGEEPFGDLEGGPDWFARGGFGDIEAYPIGEPTVIEAHRLRIEAGDGRLAATGTAAGEAALSRFESERLELFYHLRKQKQWAFHRREQNGLDGSGKPFAVIDLGREYNARFHAANRGGAPLRILWNGAESLQELRHYDNCMTEWFDVAPGDSFCTLPQGMRFAQLTVFGAEGTEFALDVRFESLHAGLAQIGELHTDRPLPEAVYRVSAHTSLICHQTGLWDGIKRDRLNWTFDFYLAAKSCYFLWDDYRVIRRAVRELGEGTPYGSWMNGICEYTLWWIKTVGEYYFHTGDRDFVLELKEPLQRHIRWVEANVDAEAGGLNVRDSILIEWVPLTGHEKTTGLQAIFALARAELDRLAAWLPELELSYRWPPAQLSEDEFMRHSDALAIKTLGIAAGYVSEETARAFLENVELRDPFTPLSAYQLAECFSARGMHERAYETIAAVWGGMLAHGATAFWEAFRLEPGEDVHDGLTTYTAYGSYRMSLCHAWSSTPVKWLSETLLGVRAVEPGFAAVRVRPAPTGGVRECRGVVPTPHGPIAVTWHLDGDGELVLDVAAPEGVRLL